jgi:hypothetical protein
MTEQMQSYEQAGERRQRYSNNSGGGDEPRNFSSKYASQQVRPINPLTSLPLYSPLSLSLSLTRSLLLALTRSLRRFLSLRRLLSPLTAGAQQVARGGQLAHALAQRPQRGAGAAH